MARNISLHAEGAETTLSLSLPAPVRVHVFRLDGPRRLVIDLPHTRRGSPLPAIPSERVVAGLHVAERRGGELRVVVALRAPAGYRVHWRGGADAELLIEITGQATRAATVARAHSKASSARSAAASAASAASAAPAAPAAPPKTLHVAHAPRGERPVIVAVDPGHGGVDPGATGPDGTHEKDVTLAIARSLAARINDTPGMHAVLTRDGDYFVPLIERIRRAQDAHANLFVSIHADSVRDPAISGASVYILSERGASSAAARELADQQNAADLRGGLSLSSQGTGLDSVLFDVTQHASIGQSGEAAQDVLRALDAIGDVHKSEVQRAAFVVLKSPLVPSMLVETAYISNPAEERRLSNAQQQQRLAAAIFKGIAAYFRQYPPQGSLFARSGGSAVVPSS